MIITNDTAINSMAVRPVSKALFSSNQSIFSVLYHIRWEEGVEDEDGDD